MECRLQAFSLCPFLLRGCRSWSPWAAARLTHIPRALATTASSGAAVWGAVGQAGLVPGHGAMPPAQAHAGSERRRLPGHLTRCVFSLCSSENHKKGFFLHSSVMPKDDVKSVGRLILLQYRNSQNQMFKLSCYSSIPALLPLLRGAVCKVIYNALNVSAAAGVSRSCSESGLMPQHIPSIPVPQELVEGQGTVASLGDPTTSSRSRGQGTARTQFPARKSSSCGKYFVNRVPQWGGLLPPPQGTASTA